MHGGGSASYREARILEDMVYSLRDFFFLLPSHLISFSPRFPLITLYPSPLLSDATTAERLFRSMGEVIACDMLVNNFDRVPLLWTNAGNANNLMCQFKDAAKARCVSIDTTSIAITAPEGVDNYLTKLSAVLTEMKTGSLEGPCISRVSSG
jgi:hypothetical protein